MASQFIRAEVIPHPGDDPQQTATINGFLQAATSIVRFVNVDRRIASMARDLVAEHRTAGLTVPDAIHLATAIVAGANMFFTYDGARDATRRRSSGLLRFNGIIGAQGLTITVPTIDYGPLFRSATPPHHSDEKR